MDSGNELVNKYRCFDVVGKTHLKHIQDVMSSHYFGWYFHSDINYGNEQLDRTKFGFVHTFIRDDVYQSDYAQLIIPIVWKAIDETGESLMKIVRVKSNMTLNCGDEDSIVIHQDLEPNCDSSWNMWSAIYYPFDSDGDTAFYEDDGITEVERITPKENSMVIFNSNIFHGGYLPKLSPTRKIINIVFATRKII
jgi:hypothetical protein